MIHSSEHPSGGRKKQVSTVIQNRVTNTSIREACKGGSLPVTLVAAYNGTEAMVLEVILSTAANGICDNTFHQKFLNMMLLC